MKTYLSMMTTLMMCAGSISAENAEVAFERKADRAPYADLLDCDAHQVHGSDYSNAVRIEKGISLEEAFDIAQGDSEIAYFVHCKSDCIVTGDSKESDFTLSLEPGDTVFFAEAEELSLKEAFGSADTYVKVLVSENIE